MNSKIEILYFITLEMLNYILALAAVLCAKSLQWCLTLCDPMDCGPLGSSVHGIFQMRILEWVAISFPGDLPNPGIKTASLISPELAGRFFRTRATWEAQHWVRHLITDLFLFVCLIQCILIFKITLNIFFYFFPSISVMCVLHSRIYKL